jgi:hypothetical protein
MVEEKKEKKKYIFEHLQMWVTCVMMVSKFRKLGSSCYPCLLALTPYDLNVP